MFYRQLRNALRQTALVGVLLSVTLAGGSVSIVSFNARLMLVGLAILSTALMATLGSDLRTPLDVGWLLLGGATFAAVVFSLDARRSLEAWVFPLALQLPYFYGAIVLLRRRWSDQAWFRALLIVGVLLFANAGGLIMTTFLTWQRLHPPLLMPFPPDFRLFNVLDNPNVFAAYLALLIPAMIGYLAVVRARLERLLIGLWLCGAVFCLIETGSRNNQFAVSVGSGVALALIAFSSTERTAAIRAWLNGHPARKSGAALAGIGAALVLIGVLVYESTSSERIIGAVSRLIYWRAALAAASQHLILGVGIGLFPVTLMQAQSVPPLLVERHAHNALFNILAESGLVGLAGLIVFGLLLIRAARIAWTKAAAPRRMVIGGLVGGLIAFGLSNLFDTPLIHAAPLFVATSFCALLAARSALTPSPEGEGSRASGNPSPLGEGFRVRALMTALSLTICGIGLVLLSLYSITWKGAQQITTGSSWAASAQTLDHGLALDPNDGLIAAQDAVAWARIAESGSDTNTLDQAIARYRAAIRLDPAYAVHHLNLAMLLRRKGDSASALAELAIAAQEAPESAVIQLNYGVALEAAGQSGAAQAAYQRTLQLEERWRGALFWQTTPIRQQARQAAPPGKLAPFLDALQTGDTARQADQPDAAHTVYLQAADHAVDDSGRYLARGWAAYANSDWDSARYNFNAVIAINDADTTHALLSLGDMAAANGDLAGMHARYQTAFTRVDAYGAFGPGRLGDITYAVNVFGRFGYLSDYLSDVLLLDITPFEAAHFVRLAQYEAAHGNPAYATMIFQRILIADPGYAPATDGLAAVK